MLRADQSQIEPIASLLAECFYNDPLIVMQTEGIPDKIQFLEKLFQAQLEIFIKTQDIFLLDDTLKSVIIGFDKKKRKKLAQLLLSVRSSLKLRQFINKNILSTYSKNVKAVSEILVLNWYKQFVGKNYYYINVIAVAPEERGKGNLRALLSPIVKYCNDNKLPIVLDTVNPISMAMYEHFGFKLVKTYLNQNADFTQYCLIKYPRT